MNMMNNKLQLLIDGREKLISSNKNEFKEKFGKKIEEENKLEEIEINKNYDYVGKQNRKIKNINRAIFVFSMLIPLSMFAYTIALLIADYINNVEIKASNYGVSFIVLFLFLIFGFVINDLASVEYKYIDSIKKTSYFQKENEYLNSLILPMGEMKQYYDILNECFGESWLKERMREKIKKDQDVGAFELILKLFNTAIKEESEKTRNDELNTKLDLILNKDNIKE